ncbi:hypothetical protein LCGC14_1024960 [marine sediment metagenome]|uniref:Uncharacterized protein n=1 Tax=marine sediment metagenome TaxID=412755 RepID=A0A0F9MWD9_9ZZZZ
MSFLGLKKPEQERYLNDDTYIVTTVKGSNHLKIILSFMEETKPEYEVLSICSDRGAKLVTPWYTLVYRKKQ